MAGDLGAEPVDLGGDVVAFEPGQALQAQIENRARLRIGSW